MLHRTFPRSLVFTLATLHFCNGQFVVVAPNLIRTDSEENVFLQANEGTGTIGVTIRITDFSTERELTTHYASLNAQNKYHTLASIRVPSTYLRRNEKENKYVNLEVNFGNQYTEKRAILVSFQAGYIFIQTNKPIYKPGDIVQIRAYVSSTMFKASDSYGVALDIKNSDGVVLEQKDSKIPNHGILTHSYTLPEIANEGKWTIQARFDHWPQNNFNTTFEVKKYVLPAFNLTVTPTKPYLDVDDTELSFEITARYLFGETIFGTAYVVYGLRDGRKIMRAPKVKKMNLEADTETLTLTMDEIKQACEVQSARVDSDCSARSLLGRYVYLKVTALTESGGDLVEVELSDVKIVHSPYVLELKDMQKYFKPGLPFHFTIHVTHHDGSPASDMNLRVHPTDVVVTSRFGTAGASINMPNKATQQSIIVTTEKPGLSAEKQARIEVTVHPYRSANTYQPNYLYIHAGNQHVAMRELVLEMSIKSDRKSNVKDITYLVLSKGKILESNRVPVREQQVTSITTPVTSEMIPTFRIVAFYIIGREVVSDSIKMQVSETCVKPPIIGTRNVRRTDFRPGKTLDLKIQGEPLAKISLVAVDQAVYLLSKQRFTQRHILDEVDSRDMGCTYGSGKNAMGVFSDAGLLFTKENGPFTENRQELKCSDNIRRRRSVLTEHQAQLLEQFQEKLLRRCCRDGLRGVLMPYSCEQRAQYITEGPECVKSFLKCCKIYKEQVISQSLDELDLGRNRGSGSSSDISDTDNNDADWDDTDFYLREKFDESWLWRVMHLPETADKDGLATLHLDTALPDSITQWSILAVSSSTKTGFCVAEPWKFVVKTPFFVDLKLPYSVARNEQVEIKAVVHNYLEDTLEVVVVLGKTTSICSAAFSRPYRRTVTVRPSSSAVVSYTIVPLITGKLPIEVSAWARNVYDDKIKRILNVVMEGVPKAETNIFPLDPAAHKGRQVVRIIKPELKGVIVPKSDSVTKIILSGNVLADSIQNAIHDDPLARLIRMPGGCVEQNLAAVTFPVIASLYLDRANAWETVGVQRKNDANQYIKIGSQHQLTFKRSDGSYPPYRKLGPSTWVTAYVVKVFTMVYTLFVQRGQHLDNIYGLICHPLEFLVRNTQSPNGRFIEATPVSNRYLTGGLQGSDSEATLSAFVSIALAQVKEANVDCRVNTQDAINKAVPYLKSYLLKSPGPRPYTTAIISYALALLTDGGYDPTSSLLAASSDGTFWPDNDSVSRLEGTGYALLALVKMQRLTEAKKPFAYLRERSSMTGSFGNTQSTMVVLHALSEYLNAQPPPDASYLNVNLQLGKLKKDLNFNAQTSYETRSFNAPEDGEYVAVAEGNDIGAIKVVTYYNQLPVAKSCETFDMEVTIQKSQREEPPPKGFISIFDFSVTVRARGPDPAFSVVLDINLPTGFTPETGDLENLLNTVERFIDHFYFDYKLSERSSLIIHMHKVSNTSPQTVAFRLLQQFNVGLLQPSSVTLYEYYKEEGQRCTQLYSPSNNQIQLTTICRDDECVCAQDDCCIVKDGQIQDKARETFACETLHHVFKVKVNNISRDYFIIYEMEIMQVIKLGVEPGVVQSEKRSFFSHSDCRTMCMLEMGSEYLIMGPERDKWSRDPATNKITYVLSEDTWVERWPTDTECKTPAFEAKCKGLTDATDHLSGEGCRQKK
ncbi:complement C3-like [Periophthalmus magnuspinnatus]|uniref:complement C3-like n=1 Tax=Periophthalmus magnuspinnatus TaxID=409849 RepID=UPI002437051A|nr:complement C3-like [Periophthalmus magnuspinnatus]